MSKPFYITTTLPYVNAEPHIGHALEFVRADVIARYKKSLGYDVFFNTGTDEHGKKILEGAEKEGLDPQEYVDRNARRFKELYPKLNISEGITFLRTTDKKHILAAQEMWRRCKANGYIYKKEYEAKYCVGCELYKTDSELEHGKCPIHPTREIEIIKEENYFFAFSKLREVLQELYKQNPTLVIPDFRFNEIKAFVDRGLEDFSISRLKKNLSWGVSVPDDDEHVMYVWFDALTSYISTLGWPDESKGFDYWKHGEPVQYCGKDNLRQQSAIWQAMLIASGLPGTKHIIINGFILSGGQKMSKSTGNVINPFDVIEMFQNVTEFPEDVLRFLLLHEISSFEDGDLTIDSMKVAYNAYLANGIGNLTSRILKMATTNGVYFDKKETPLLSNESLNAFDTNRALKELMVLMRVLDERIATEEPFKVIKNDEATGKKMIAAALDSLYDFATRLSLYMPRTGEIILKCILENKMPEKPLFGRL